MIMTEKKMRNIGSLNINRRNNMKKDWMAELYFPLAFIFGQLAVAVIAVTTIVA